jgi:hypothetical protein
MVVFHAQLHGKQKWPVQQAAELLRTGSTNQYDNWESQLDWMSSADDNRCAAVR